MLSTDHNTFGLVKSGNTFCAKGVRFSRTAELAVGLYYANSGRCHTGS